MRSAVLVVTLILAVVFCLLNTEKVTVYLGFGHYNIMVSVVVVGALTLGLLAGACAMIPWGWRARRACRQACHRADLLEKRLAAPAENLDQIALPASREYEQ